MGGAMTKADEGGQDPIDEDQLVFRPGTRGPTTGTRGETSLVPLVPQRADLGDEFGDHSRLQPRDPLASRDRCTYPAPHHTGHDPRSRPQCADANHARARKGCPAKISAPSAERPEDLVRCSAGGS